MQCQDLQDQVTQLLDLIAQEPHLRSQDLTPARTALRKAISPKFEIVFAGAFSAGKSMLINALLERKLLYSAEGHATGTECQIAYAEAGQERVILTFLSEVEITQLCQLLCEKLKLPVENSETLKQQCLEIIQAEGGAARSERAKQASALSTLLEGCQQNRDRILPNANAIYPMEQLNFSSLQEAANYARRGANSAVLKRIEYFCHHPLLQDGNVFVDTPGIDAPVKRDAELTYEKIQDDDTSAVICVLKAAESGELVSEETQLLETVRANAGIRDRVFYIFNRIDKTWYAAQLRQRLENILQEQFPDQGRVYKTSGLLGFYGSQLKSTSPSDRWGLDSLFAEEVQSIAAEEAPQFVTEFNNYCASGKLVGSVFRPEVRGYERPNENYVRILSECGTPLIEQLIKDSGIEEFRTAIKRYLTEEKRPQLFSNLADDLYPLCLQLRKSYLDTWHHFEAQPKDVKSIEAQELRQLSQDLSRLGDALSQHLEQELNQAVASQKNQRLEDDYRRLQARMVARLDELLKQFSVGTVHQQAQASHRRNSVVPLLGILAEAFYYLANGLEEVLVQSAQELMSHYFDYLREQISKQEYYRELHRFLGDDCGLEARLMTIQERVLIAIANEAQVECDRYVRERPEFYTEGTVSMWQLRQTLQQASRGYDYHSMVEAEAAIRQLLKLDFEQKVKETVMRTFRSAINQTLNYHLLGVAKEHADVILQQHERARVYLAQILSKEAETIIQSNQQQQEIIKDKIEGYNQVVRGINAFLESMQLHRKQLPEILESDFLVVPHLLDAEIVEPEESEFTNLKQLVEMN